MAIPIDPHYIPAFSIEDVILDKDTGAPLSGGLVHFEQDNQRGIQKPVYQITGTSPNYAFIQLPNPVVLSSIGTFEDSLGNPVIPYFYPYDDNQEVELYYVWVESSEGVFQFAREAQPYVIDPDEQAVSSAHENEISNPQFAEVLFDTSTPNYIYNFTAGNDQEVEIAPDWSLRVSCAGAGTVTVAQLTPAGSLNIPTNPGTLLNINSTGLTSLTLYQRIYGSPNLWGSGWLSGTFLAKTYGGTAVDVVMQYVQSSGTVVAPITEGTLPASNNYDVYPNAFLIPSSDSSESFPDAYIEIQFRLPLGTEIDISSIMLASTGDVSIDNIIYDQESQNRQIDHLFHYYQPLINYKPIPSMLTAWDFPLNPAQIGTTGNIPAAASAAYIWDQTFALRGATDIAYARNAVTGGIQFTTAGAVPDAFLIGQYLSGAQAKKILGTPLSVNMNAYRGTAGGAVTYRVYLFRGSSAAVFPILPLMIGSLATTGIFTKNSTAAQGLNWTEIARGNLGAVSGTLSTVATNDEINNGLNDYGYSGWEVVDATEIGDTDKFAMIVTFSYAAISTVITVNSVSMVPGEIPTRPAPQTLDQVFRESSYYYQKSFPVGTVPAQNAGVSSASLGVQTTAALATGSGGPIVRFEVSMRAVPNIVLYNPSAANAEIYNGAISASWSSSDKADISEKGFFTTGQTPLTSTAGESCLVHWTADARLGVVA